MKKMILWALLAFGMSTGMQAQTDVSFGFKGGLNVTKFWLKKQDAAGSLLLPLLRRRQTHCLIESKHGHKGLLAVLNHTLCF